MHRMAAGRGRQGEAPRGLDACGMLVSERVVRTAPTHSMRVLVTGHLGYIGTVMVPMLLSAGHDVVGLDSDLYAACSFGAGIVDIPTIRADIRGVDARHLEGVDAVLHIAALSNDPLSDLNPEITYDVNHRGSVRLAALAKRAGVPRFVFSSSCSTYGAAGDEFLTESAELKPLTAYAISKVRVEQDVARLADDRFSPTFLRNATAYGRSSTSRTLAGRFSPRWKHRARWSTIRRSTWGSPARTIAFASSRRSCARPCRDL